MRACDLCGGVDDELRHVTNCDPGAPGSVPDPDIIRLAVQNGADDAAVQTLLDPTTLIRHKTCCRDNGCATCAESLGI